MRNEQLNPDSRTNAVCAQWRSKVSDGPWFNSNLGALPFPHPPLLPPCPSPSPPIPQPRPSPLPRSGPQIQLGGLGNAVSSPVGSGAEPQPKLNLVHFSLKIRHLVATIVMIFKRVLPNIFLLGGPRSSGAPVH